jgi:proline iminopeptidase
MRAFIKVSIFLFLIEHVSGQDGFVGNSPALAFWTVGSKEEIVIVLHGGPGAAHEYLRPEWDVLTHVAKVVYYDQRGCGKSEKADCYTWKVHVEDLKKVVNAFSKDKRVILAGSSWGTTLALLYAYTYPQDVKGMILTGTVAWPGKGTSLRDCSFYTPDYREYLLMGLDTSLQYTSLKYKYSIKAPEVCDSAFIRKMREDKCFASPFYERIATLNSLNDAPEILVLQKIQVPTLVVGSTGKCDEQHSYLKDASAEYAVLPRAEIFAVDGPCHDSWFSASKSFFSKCIDFIDKLK